MLAVDQYEFPQHFPKPGWVEHDAVGDLADSQLRAARGVLERAGAMAASDVAAIGITNQRETATGLGSQPPASPSTPPSCGSLARRRPSAKELRARGLEEEVRSPNGAA